MNEKRHNVPKKLIQGKTNKSSPANVPSMDQGGKIITNFQEIRWTKPKLTLVSVALLAPITFTIVLCFKAGNSLIGLILIGIIMFMGLMSLALRYIDNNEF